MRQADKAEMKAHSSFTPRSLPSVVSLRMPCAQQPRGTEKAGVHVLSVQPGRCTTVFWTAAPSGQQTMSSLDLHTMMVLGFHVDESKATVRAMPTGPGLTF